MTSCLTQDKHLRPTFLNVHISPDTAVGSPNRKDMLLDLSSRFMRKIFFGGPQAVISISGCVSHFFLLQGLFLLWQLEPAPLPTLPVLKSQVEQAVSAWPRLLLFKGYFFFLLLFPLRYVVAYVRAWLSCVKSKIQRRKRTGCSFLCGFPH